MAEFRIDAEGVWYYRGMEMSRRDIVGLFYRNLRKDASGQYWIEIGKQRCRVDIEDTAYVVLAVRASSRTGSLGTIYLYLSDGSIEELNPSTVRIGKGNVPYCRVKDAAFEARFSTSAYYQLAEHISEDSPHNGYYIAIAGKTYYIPELPNH